MLKPGTISLALVGICALPSVTSRADTISLPMVPAAVVSQFVGLPTGANSGGDTFGSFSVAYPGSAMAGAMIATTSALAGTDPSVTASASFSGSPGPYASGRIDADSELVYYFEVTGPSGGQVPLILAASGTATSYDNNVAVYASLDVVELLGNGSYPNIYSVAACGSYEFTFCSLGPNLNRFVTNKTLQLSPNQIYEIVIETNIQSGTYSGALAAGAFSANALVDPKLQLASGVSNQYQIVASSNLASTPEPESIVLTMTGAVAMIAFGHKTLKRSTTRT